MSMARKLGKGLGVMALGLVVIGAGGYVWAGHAADAYLARTYEAHRQGFPIPFPLTEAEIAQLRAERSPPDDPSLTSVSVGSDGAPAADSLAGIDLDALARERAIARAKHLLDARFPCVECHGTDFGGGTMIDDPAIGVVLGPNLTTGAGSVTLTYTAEDWDRKVRHGLGPSGVSGPMPSEDFLGMSDQELSDIVTYIRSLPPVDKQVPLPTLGPLGRILMATGQIPTTGDSIKVQRTEHPLGPPVAAPTAEFGEHLLTVCTGCHRANFEGGPIPGGPPDWLPAANLSPHEQGLKGWTEADFVRALREGKKRDGSPQGVPMNLIPKYAANMTDTELTAMWMALQAMPPVADGD